MKVDKYFLEEVCPFTQRRRIKWHRVKGIAFAVALAGLVAILTFSPEEEREPRQNGVITPSTLQTPVQQNDIDYSPLEKPYSLNPTSRSKAPRQYSASQVVKRGDSTNKLPTGSVIKASLVNTIVSTDANSPAIAQITEDIYWKSSLIIPRGAKAIGQGVLDDSTERLQIRFNTLVFPEGEQHSISALALLPDGSSGISGDFHSRRFPKQAGRFVGTFIGGLAQGLKDKDTHGQSGIVFEPGSLKNGILNGIANSSVDQANSITQNSERLKPYLQVSQGTAFLIYLEKEFSP